MTKFCTGPLVQSKLNVPNMNKICVPNYSPIQQLILAPSSKHRLKELKIPFPLIKRLKIQGPQRRFSKVERPAVAKLQTSNCKADPKEREQAFEAMEVSGLDSDGKQFKNAEEMWREQIGEEGEQQHEKKTQWYRDGVSYWEGVEASVDGVLGGFGNVNEVDIKGSEVFLQTLLSERFPNAGRSQHLVALDCGSGIGRITKNLLIRYFNEVDLLEPVSHFLDAARESLAPKNHMASDTHKAGNFFCVPLQEFTPDAGKYDVIWIQWCIGHLTDDDFVSFFKRAKVGLKPGGFFVLKENIARSGFVLDKEDRSITRSDLYFKELFSRSGLHIYKSKDQKGFPEELFAVKMYALTTEMPKRVPKTKSKVEANRPCIIR